MRVLLQQRMPARLAAAGLAGAEVFYAGDTALGLSPVDRAAGDLVRVALGVVDLLLVVAFLRGSSPCRTCSPRACSGRRLPRADTWVFQDLLDRNGVIFYLTFAAAVQLVALGSDYNIFSVGYIWEGALSTTLPAALAVAVPRSTKAINAGISLAASFALVALIPIARSKSSRSRSPSARSSTHSSSDRCSYRPSCPSSAG